MRGRDDDQPDDGGLAEHIADELMDELGRAPTDEELQSVLDGRQTTDEILEELKADDEADREDDFDPDDVVAY